ncbi:MAG TPA: sensor histidine kinase [Herpetosiphonaceae bacterium]
MFDWPWFRAAPGAPPRLRALRRWGMAALGDYLPHALALIWLLHVQLLLGLDNIAAAVRADVHPLPGAYYLAQSLPPLLMLGLASVRPLAARLGARLLPLVIVAMAILPVALTALTVDAPQRGPLTASSSFLAFRMVPIQLLAFSIVAWRYGWRQVVAFCLVFGLAFLVVNRLAWVQLSPLGVTLAVITLLINGRWATLLVDQLRIKTRALEQANQQLRHYAATLEQLTVSRERNRMARELHDTLAHTLADLAVQMETAKAYVRVDPDTARAVLDTALGSARSGLNDTRRSLKSLRANPLSELGLADALRALAAGAADAAGAELELSIADALPTLPPDSEQALYRIAQEALANIKYHAGAAKIRVALAAAGEALLLEIADDGRGFQTAAPVSAGHYGLAGMAEWAQVSGGALRIESAPGKGTMIRFEMGGG